MDIFSSWTLYFQVDSEKILRKEFALNFVKTAPQSQNLLFYNGRAKIIIPNER